MSSSILLGLIPRSRKMSMMQNVQNLEERLKDITSDLQKLKEEFESAVNSLSPVGIPEYSRPKERSFFYYAWSERKEWKYWNKTITRWKNLSLIDSDSILLFWDFHGQWYIFSLSKKKRWMCHTE